MPQETTANLLTIRDIAEKLDKVTGPNSGGWYTACCPAHDDTKPSFGFGPGKDRGIAAKCHSNHCKYKDIVTAIEKTTGKKWPGKKRAAKPAPIADEGPFNLAAYTRKTGLPGYFVQLFYHVLNAERDGRPCVAFPYINENGKHCGTHFRFYAEHGEGPKYTWGDGYSSERSTPYGIDTLLFLQKERGWDLSRMAITEGASDVQTLVYNGIPALGIPGKNAWKPEYARIPILANAKEIIVSREPDAEEFAEAITSSFPAGKVVIAAFDDERCKDPNMLWLRGPETFLREWDKKIAEGRDRLIPFTDTGNTERLVLKHGENFRWLTDACKFHTWNGQRWEPAENGDGQLLSWTKEVVRSISDPKWRNSSESSVRRHAMLSLAKGEMTVLAERKDFNKNPMLLNVKNGTVDLETGQLRDFCREDFINAQSPVEWDAMGELAECPQFDNYLNFTFGGDEDLIHFIVKAMGYTLTGLTGEHKFFMCQGPGGNGKTQLLELMSSLLGHDLAMPAKFSTFVESRGFENSDYELASFVGARLVMAVEPKGSGRLNEALLKQITGGDAIKARPIYGHPFVYRPEFKLWLAMNNPPRITGTDEGIWRRVCHIPFHYTVPPERRIQDFHKKLLAEEGPAILSRLLRGVRDWREEGLKPPSAVVRATAEFRESEDVVGRFIRERCVTVNPNLHVKCGTLYDAYKAWAEAGNEFVMTATAFGKEMDQRAFDKKRVRDDGEHRFGIGLLV